MDEQHDERHGEAIELQDLNGVQHGENQNTPTQARASVGEAE